MSMRENRGNSPMIDAAKSILSKHDELWPDFFRHGTSLTLFSTVKEGNEWMILRFRRIPTTKEPIRFSR